jgi:hypothetical protein
MNLTRWAAGAAATVALTGSVALAAPALAAPAAPTHPAAVAAPLSIIGDDSPGQAGYGVTGLKLHALQATTFLRNGGQYASELIGVGGSVSLWDTTTGDLVLLGVSTGTGAANEPYSPGFNVYKGKTLVAFQGQPAVHDSFCTAADVCTAGSGNTASGQNDQFGMWYNAGTGNVSFTETFANGDVYHGFYHIGAGLAFTKGEVTSDFGNTPFDQAGYKAPPAARTKLQAWSGAVVTNAKGNHFPLTGYFTTETIRLTGAGSVVEADPGPLNAAHNGFSTYLEP